MSRKRREAAGSFIMVLAAIVKQEVFDSLSSEFKAEYKKQDDGMFMLDVTPTDDFALENVKGLKTALSSERTAREEAERKIKVFDGLDAGKAKDALKKVEEMANWKPDDKVKEQIEAIKNQLTEKHQGELGKKDESLKSLTGQLEKVMIEAAAIKAIAENKGSAALLLPHVKSATRMRQTDKGEYFVEVIGDDGNARISPAAGSTTSMSITELVAEMKTQETFAPAFEGSGASGSGASGSSGTQVKNGVYTISSADAKDPYKYRAAKEVATKAGSNLQIADS